MLNCKTMKPQLLLQACMLIVSYYKVLYLNLIIWPSTGSAQIFRSSCRKDALFKATDRDKILSGLASNLLGSTRVTSLALCAKACVNLPRCVSFNYKKKPATGVEKNCQLLDVDKGDSTAASLSSAAGWIHYEPVMQVCQTLFFLFKCDGIF